MNEDERGSYAPLNSNPKQRARLLAALYLAQEQYGWLSSEAIQYVADKLSLKIGQVQSTASFYSMFRLKPQGEYRIQVCEGLSCYLVGGAEPILDHISRKLGIQSGETTPDGKFSLEVVQCLASCGTAPALRINDELYERMTFASIDKLLESLGCKI
ncbi:MAG: NAD(P)H-dependent oxidoreductase subunit E [Anaerolineales bacterium]|nr:NAD(P)H-dependent oxidoreductase subunit E [Anaerolineales bacterium]